MSAAVAEPKLTEAQKRALREISQAGGHSFGAYSYLPARTAEKLGKLGLVVLGWKHTTDRRTGQPTVRPWAIAKGATPPDFFETREAYSARWDAACAEMKARQEAAKAAREPRVQAVLAVVNARVRDGETPEARAARIAKVEEVIRSGEKSLAEAEKLLGLVKP